MKATPDLDLSLLRAFATVADERSFTRAADRVHRSQSAVSLQIRRLEERLGRRLFERSSRNVRLTPQGQSFLVSARQLLRLHDELAAGARQPQEDALGGLIRLGTPEDFATLHLPRVLASFARSHPRVALEVECDFTLNLLRGFRRGRFDLVLVKRQPRSREYGEGRGVWREALSWAAASRFSALRDEVVPLVLSPEPCVYRRRALEALTKAGVRHRVAYTSPSLAGAQAAVRAGLGVTVLPRQVVPRGLRLLGRDAGFPPLQNAEIALLTRRSRVAARGGAPGGEAAAVERLADHITRALEQEAGAAGAR